MSWEFGDALRALRGGKCVRRHEWLGTNMWIRLQLTADKADHIVAVHPGGRTSMWHPVQSDVLAEDWQEAKP